MDYNSIFDKPVNNLENLMRENGYTLKKVSEETNIPITTLSGYKKNSRTPKKENAKILADYFGVSVPYLLGLDDNPSLKDPGQENIFVGMYKVLTKGTSIDNKITKWTPFGDELAVILAEINKSEQLADYIDFLASKNQFNPVLVKAIKQFIADKEDGFIPFLINKSGDKNSPYHYVWEEWSKSQEYQDRQKAKKK